jgi:hypothetical protein
MKCSVCDDTVAKTEEFSAKVKCPCGKKHVICPECVAEGLTAANGTLIFTCECGTNYGVVAGGLAEMKSCGT